LTLGTVTHDCGRGEDKLDDLSGCASQSGLAQIRGKIKVPVTGQRDERLEGGPKCASTSPAGWTGAKTNYRVLGDQYSRNRLLATAGVSPAKARKGNAGRNRLPPYKAGRVVRRMEKVSRPGLNRGVRPSSPIVFQNITSIIDPRHENHSSAERGIRPGNRIPLFTRQTAAG